MFTDYIYVLCTCTDCDVLLNLKILRREEEVARSIVAKVASFRKIKVYIVHQMYIDAACELFQKSECTYALF